MLLTGTEIHKRLRRYYFHQVNLKKIQIGAMFQNFLTFLSCNMLQNEDGQEKNLRVLKMMLFACCTEDVCPVFPFKKAILPLVVQSCMRIKPKDFLPQNCYRTYLM